MKTHTIGFKQQIVQLGRQLKGLITYNSNVEEIELEEEIYSITPHYEADLLKSVMKQLDLELSVDIPINTIINCKVGLKVNNEYEMLDYGNYIVYKSEKQEDTGTYKITCYDKMLYAMKQNESLGIEYPITIKNYLIALATKIGLSVANTTFYNQDMTIPGELYLGFEYTYRDILDEIAQATGSIICLNENDEIFVKYPTLTNDTIDEDFLKDVNVKFGQKYGVINSIVLSRSGESDNVYLRDEESVAENGLTEIKIVDNQIMNFNNRSDFLEGILNALNGLYYYINDFSSTGILYYDVGDLYNIQIGENTYQCLMLNDEINVTTGIEELIHTDLPQKTETNYTKADKTDLRINKTYLIVDKQNQTIESVINNVDSQNNKISQITQTVDELNSKIEDIADITTYGESTRALIELDDINESEPIMIRIHPTSQNISYLYPRANLYPSDDLFMPDRIIQFYREYTEEGIDKYQYIWYTLPDDLLRYSDEIYDEFYLNYESQTCQVIKRCGYNADGTVRVLDEEITTDYEYPQIILGEGNYTITLPGYNFAYMYVRLMAKNIYTTQFYTKVETNSKIQQKADEINLGISRTLTNYSTTNQMNSAINMKADEITSSVSNTYETKSHANSQYNTLNTRYSQVNQKADSLTSTVADIEQDVETNTNDIGTNRSNINTNRSNISILQQTATSLQSQINSNDRDISTLQQTATSLQSQIRSNDTDISTLQQTAQGLTSTVSQKVGYNEIISKINQSAEAVTIQASKININGTVSANGNFKVDTSGNMTCKNATVTGNITATTGKIAGYTINGNMLVGANVGISGKSGEGWAFWSGSNDAGSSPFRVGHDGHLYATNADIQGTIRSSDAIITGGKFYVSGDGDASDLVRVTNSSNSSQFSYLQPVGAGFVNGNYRIDIFTRGEYSDGRTMCSLDVHDSKGTSTIRGDGISTPRLTQTSLESEKKNFDKFTSALDIIKNIDIYKYNLKNEEDGTKKHIGFVIGKDFKYSEEVTSNENDGVDIYSFVSLCCQAIKEQNTQIEQMKKELEELKGGNK